MNRNQQKGFTLLEIIIVIIIVGVLASLALPRFFSTVEFSRSTEAFNAMASIRKSLERCYIMNDGNYGGCDITDLDLSDPGASPGSHFSYIISNQSATAYVVTARRLAATANWIAITVSNAGGIARSGAGDFVNID